MEGEEPTTITCGPTSNMSYTFEPPAKYNVCGLSLSNPMHPPFTDPLYAPYVEKSVTGPFSCNVSKYKHIPPYPLVDPARMRVGEGIRFRSQYDGICPLGYVMGPNNLCIAQDEPIGRFYDKAFYMRYPVLLGCQNTDVDNYRSPDPRSW